MGNALEGKKILITDDDSTGEVAKLFLEEEGAEVVLVKDGEAALGELEKGPFDLLLADYRMPKLTGLQLLEAIKERFPEMIRFVLSAHLEDKEREAFKENGATEIIDKPPKTWQILVDKATSALPRSNWTEKVAEKDEPGKDKGISP